MIKAQPLDIQSLHQAYQEGLSAKALIEECCRRIDDLNDPGIFLYRMTTEQLQQQLETLGPFDLDSKPLWGIPIAVKDNIDVAETPTTAACPAFSHKAEQDAFIIKQLRQAGAIIIGKTNLDQFATGLVGVRTPYPAPKNALDPEIVPGGSSSGSAVAVAQGLVSFSLGTDTAGSGRVPAALNSIVGLKPSLGMISSSGVVPACRTLDTVSIFAMTVQDCYQALELCCAFDPADSYSKALQTKPMESAPTSFTVGVPSPDSIRFFGDQLQAERFSADLDTLVSLGANIVSIDFTPFYEIAALLYGGSWVAERYAATQDLVDNNPELLHPATLAVISQAVGKTAVETFRDLYRLQDFKRLTDPLIDQVDLLCVPTIPTFYKVSDLEADPIQPNSNLGTYTNFVNLLDLCGIAVPTQPRVDGRPGSITLLARSGEDALTASIAAKVQQHCQPALGASGWTLPGYPAADTEAASPDHLEIAVVGAHMTDLPLNHQLTDLGALFVGKSATAPQYRLYRLAGGPPLRPGLVRSTEGTSIELEIWSLPISKVGAFLAEVPSPLAIGTLELEDGREVKGFICEDAITSNAEDISKFKGWRAYLTSQAQP